MLISFGLLGFLLYRIPFEPVLDHLGTNLVGPLLFGAMLLLLGIILSALRWQLLIEISGAGLKWHEIIELALIGHFFNQLLPTSVGGDIIRVAGGIERGLTAELSFGSVFLDRVVGLWSLIFLILAGQPILASRFDEPLFTIVAIIAVVTVIAGTYLLFILDKVTFTSLQSYRIYQIILSLSIFIRQLFKRPFILVSALAISIVVHLIVLYLVSYFAQTLGAGLDLVSTFLIVPSILLVASLPISIAGWGVREVGLVIGFTMLGLPESVALASSILVGLSNLVSGLPGGLIWVSRAYFRDRE